MDTAMAKKAFIDAYAKTFGNVTEAAKIVSISRQTYYNWIKDDPDFQAELQAVEPAEQIVDLAENGLIKKIQSGDVVAIIFALKTKGKHRGYVERSEIAGVKDQPLEVITGMVIK